MIKRKSEKFLFDIEFQWHILRYTLQDRDGYKALILYKYDYFDLEEQKIIARAIQRFFKRTQRVPKLAAVLNEELNQLFKTKDYAQAFLNKDRIAIKKRVRQLFNNGLKEPEEIFAKVKTFASYVEFKKVIEEVNLTDYNQYQTYLKKIQNAINLGVTLNEKKGMFLVNSINTRLITRKNNDELIISTNIKQMDKLTNAGGYAKGSVIVFIDRPKRGKTLLLVNIARWFISKRSEKLKGRNKKVIYFDLENGEANISARLDQAIVRSTKSDILNGKFDLRLKKIYRKFKRLGGEIYTQRMPAYSTTTDFQRVMDEIYNEYGIKFEVGIIDYMGLMGSVSGKKEDQERISDAYIDVKNWADHNGLDMVFTGHHVKREGYDRRAYRYRPDDLAKTTEIERHVDAIYGIQQNENEETANIVRLELIVQRDGLPSGRCLFNLKLDQQRLTEFTSDELEKYAVTLGKEVQIEPGRKIKRKLDDE